jgi:hypothetical protein
MLSQAAPSSIPEEGDVPLEATLHVVPGEDLIAHDTSGEPCVCGASVERYIGCAGSEGKVVTHHSLDGREFAETGHLIPQEPGGDELRVALDPGE